MDKRFELLPLLLVVVGALNWGLVGLFEFDLVATLVGEEFGEVNLISRIVYILVGLAGLTLIPFRATRRTADATATDTSTTYA